MEEQQKGKRRISVITIALIILVVVAIIVVVAIVIGVVKNKAGSKDSNELEGYLALVDVEDDIYTFLDANNKIYQYQGYASMTNFYNDVACVSAPSTETMYRNDYGLITSKSKVVVPFGKYDYITQVSGGKFYKVEIDDVYGLIDYNGNEIIPVQYDYIRDVTIKDGTVHFFVCEYDKKGTYDYINEEGILIAQTESYATINYYYTVNDDFTTALRIDGKYYNSKTGDKLFEGIENEGYKYNILAGIQKYYVYDKDLVLKDTVGCPNATGFDITTYDEYTIVKQYLNNNATAEEKAQKYTLYDSDLNVVKQSGEEIIFNVGTDGNLYFFNSDDNGNIIVSNRDGVEVFRVSGHKKPTNNSSKIFISIQNKDTKLYDLYDYTGNQVLEEGVAGIYTSKTSHLEEDYMVVSTKDEKNNTNYFILLNNLVKIPVTASTNVVEKIGGNILVSDYSAKIVKLYNDKGEQVGEDIKGQFSKNLGNYILVDCNDKYVVVNLEKLEISFEFNKSEHIKTYDDIKVFELSNGYYTVDGEQLLVRE